LPVYRCSKCGRAVELPEGTYICKYCGALMKLVEERTRPKTKWMRIDFKDIRRDLIYRLASKHRVRVLSEAYEEGIYLYQLYGDERDLENLEKELKDTMDEIRGIVEGISSKPVYASE